ncbi:MAG: hypothetical protein AAFZ07_11565 [Actinomycetota bacterium]
MVRRPPPWALVKELGARGQMRRLALAAPRLQRAPRGDGGPVLLVAGFGSTAPSLLPLQTWLRSLGHDAHTAELGAVGRDLPAEVSALCEQAAERADSSGRGLALVGWSLGGVVAREAARESGVLIRRVVTFGAPTMGGPAAMALAAFYGEARLAEIESWLDARRHDPILVPLTTIWSARDGVVADEARHDELTPSADHVEVHSAHVAMALDPDVWLVIADRLASDGRAIDSYVG